MLAKIFAIKKRSQVFAKIAKRFAVLVAGLYYLKTKDTKPLLFRSFLAICDQKQSETGTRMTQSLTLAVVNGFAKYAGNSVMHTADLVDNLTRDYIIPSMCN